MILTLTCPVSAGSASRLFIFILGSWRGFGTLNSISPKKGFVSRLPRACRIPTVNCRVARAFVAIVPFGRFRVEGSGAVEGIPFG